jgi:hypothetical protein
VLLALAAPLIIRFGTFWRIVIGFLALQFFWGSFVEILLRFSLKSGFFLGIPRWSFFSSLLALALLAISLRVSVWLYDRREF